MAKVETETQARQGAKGKPVLYVLIGGLLLAVIAAIGALTWQGEKAPPDRAGQSQDAARGTATGGNSSDSAPAKPNAQ